MFFNTKPVIEENSIASCRFGSLIAEKYLSEFIPSDKLFWKSDVLVIKKLKKFNAFLVEDTSRNIIGVAILNCLFEKECLHVSIGNYFTYNNEEERLEIIKKFVTQL